MPAAISARVMLPNAPLRDSQLFELAVDLFQRDQLVPAALKRLESHDPGDLFDRDIRALVAEGEDGDPAGPPRGCGISPWRSR